LIINAGKHQDAQLIEDVESLGRAAAIRLEGKPAGLEYGGVASRPKPGPREEGERNA